VEWWLARQEDELAVDGQGAAQEVDPVDGQGEAFTLAQ
jgi:hypothetical protein